jgi:drug/metabolite transporter (DMT)-like permease
VLCRLALSGGSIDPASFATVRIASGAATLLLIVASSKTDGSASRRSWGSAAAMFLYVVPFSFAYAGLTAGTGALILFGAVQLTMMSTALYDGERPRPLQWLGFASALAGLACLVWPGLTAPSSGAAALMAVAGCAWGVYSLRGRGAGTPLADTAANFVRATPLVAVVSLATLSRAHLRPAGVAIAIASGALASALGYVIWYAALRRLTTTRAAIVQLAVPVLAAAAGAVVLGETISARLVLAAAMVLGGIALAIRGRSGVRG